MGRRNSINLLSAECGGYYAVNFYFFRDERLQQTRAKAQPDASRNRIA